MTDFVTRLEDELRRAALRRERAGGIRGVALPRLRVGLSDLPVVALATALLGLAVLGVAIMLASSPRQPAGAELPSELRGAWRQGATELRLFPAGSQRCANLGLGGEDPCYTIGSSKTGVAEEWGRLSASGREVTLRDAQGGPPGVYRWGVEGRTLRLAEVRDNVAARSRALAAEPLTRLREQRRETRIPITWTGQSFTSERYGYSIRFSEEWAARPAPSAGQSDLLSRDPGGSALPAVAIAATDVPAATTPARWAVIVDARSEGECPPYTSRMLEADGETVRITTFRNCGGTSSQWASFVHRGRGYSALWRGKPGRAHVDADAPLFDAMLKTIVLSR
jgi:hypothetical protein